MYYIVKKLELYKQAKIYKFIMYCYIFIATIDSITYFPDNANLYFYLLCIINISLFVKVLIEYIESKKELHEGDYKLINKLLDKKETLMLYSFSMLFIIVLFINWINEMLEKVELPVFSQEIFTLMYFVYAIVLMADGINKNSVKYFNVGEILFTIQILRFVFGETDNLMLRGIICIIVSLIFIAFNKNFTNKIKSKIQNNIRS